NLGDAAAFPRRVDRDEAVHLAVEAHALDDLSAIRLERAAVVVQLDARHPRDQSIGDARREVAAQRRILAFLPPTGYDVVAFGELVEQTRDVGRIVLQ